MENEAPEGEISENYLDAFFQLIADCKTEKEARLVFGSFLSESEQDSYAKRLNIWHLISQKATYQKIKDVTKASSATIAVAQKASTKEGFKKTIQLIEAEIWANTVTSKIKGIVGR
jgi:uncharacterized protein YerC